MILIKLTLSKNGYYLIEKFREFWFNESRNITMKNYLRLIKVNKCMSNLIDVLIAAGDNIKFGFPMAASTTMLTWGLLRYKDAYQHSGELENMYACVRWPLEWMLKCHTGTNELYVQV